MIQAMPLLPKCEPTRANASVSHSISPNITGGSKRTSLQYSPIATDLASYMDGVRIMEARYGYRNTVDVDALAAFDDNLSEMSTNTDCTAEEAARAQARKHQEGEHFAQEAVEAQPQEGEETIMDISQSNPNAAASGIVRTKPTPHEQEEDMNLPTLNPYGFYTGNTAIATNSSFEIRRPRLFNGNYLPSPQAPQDPDGQRPLGPQKDPSGKLIHEPSGRLINTASGRLIPEQQKQKQQQQQQTKDDDSRTTYATSKTTQSSAGAGPIRRVTVPCSGVDSVCPSVLTADTDGLIFLGTAPNNTTTKHGHPNIHTHKEFLLLVEFHWQPRKWLWSMLPIGHALQPDHPTLPRVLRPYLRPSHWQIFLQAVLRLVYRDHRMGFLYILLGMLANLAGVAYLFYAMVPIPGHPDKVLDWPIAFGAGFGLLTAGVCLCVWGRANRGGLIYQQDMEAICANTSNQIKGLTIRFRTPDSLFLQSDGKDDEKHGHLAFGLEFFCADADEEEDPTQSTTHPTNHHASEDLGYIVGDRELPSSSLSPPSSTKALSPPSSPYKLRRVVSKPMLAASAEDVEVGMV